MITTLRVDKSIIPGFVYHIVVSNKMFYKSQSASSKAWNHVAWRNRVGSHHCGYIQLLHHTTTFPSAPALTSHGCLFTHLTCNTPSPSLTSCPRRIFRGTISGSVMRSLYTLLWKTWMEPSSEEEAKRGYVGWKWSDRMALAW